ncbi:MAG: threonine synthase [Euryarchaeota archaeon RBG_16_67_27]|nr:MAG: threonine synthase [Euryarchaeota archaeon RBG_16_67_27]
MGYVRSLRCRECGAEYPPTRLVVCEACFGPLEVAYEFDAVREAFTRDSIARRPGDLWRYRELLPVFDEGAKVDLQPGYTPLRRADNLASELGLRELWVKDDTVNPTSSFKDVAVAVAKAREWGLEAVGCASTGNLAAATAAAAAKARLPCYVFTPAGLEETKLLLPRIYGATVVPVDGTYDDANRVAILAADRRGWGFVNINLRPYYAEGSKTLLFETWEQLGFELPDVVVTPLGSGLLLTSVDKAIRELKAIGQVNGVSTRLVGTQAAGCAPIVRGFESADGRPRPVKRPDTIAESLAIGDPASGHEAIQIMRRTRGFADAPSDPEIIEAQRLLARTEGVFAEPAGGTTVATLKRALEDGRIDRDERVVLLVTGNGLKAPSVLSASFPPLTPVAPNAAAVDAFLGGIHHG